MGRTRHPFKIIDHILHECYLNEQQYQLVPAWGYVLVRLVLGLGEPVANEKQN